jgi:hypothetical protein
MTEAIIDDEEKSGLPWGRRVIWPRKRNATPQVSNQNPPSTVQDHNQFITGINGKESYSRLLLAERIKTEITVAVVIVNTGSTTTIISASTVLYKRAN